MWLLGNGVGDLKNYICWGPLQTSSFAAAAGPALPAQNHIPLPCLPMGVRMGVTVPWRYLPTGGIAVTA